MMWFTMSHKYWFKVLIVVAVLASMSVLASYFYSPTSTSVFLNNLLRSATPNATNVTNPNPNFPSVPAANNSTNSTGGGAAGTPSSGSPAVATSASNASVQVSLEISNICSSTPLFEGIVLCANQPSPYYIVIQNDSSTINTTFYNITGFNQTLSFGGNVLLFNIYMQDLSTLNSGIQNITISGNISSLFSTESYSVTYSSDTAIALVPLYLDSNMLSPADWSNLDFNVSTSQKNYFVGTLWFKIL